MYVYRVGEYFPAAGSWNVYPHIVYVYLEWGYYPGNSTPFHVYVDVYRVEGEYFLAAEPGNSTPPTSVHVCVYRVGGVLLSRPTLEIAPHTSVHLYMMSGKSISKLADWKLWYM